MIYVHVKKLEKYQPGYTDRRHRWAKIYFDSFLDEAIQVLDEINRYRFWSLIVLEVFLEGKPLALTAQNLKLMGWNSKKRHISLTLQMLHTLVEVRNDESESSVTQSRVEKSRVEESRVEKERVIFDCWNSFKGKRNWKSHRELSYEISEAITKRLKHYTVEQICGAIRNYAATLLSRDCLWSYAWTLYQFLTRHSPQQRDELQIYRFLPNNFSMDDYLKPEAKKRIIEQQRKQRAVPQPINEPLSVEQKKEIREQVGRF